MDRGSVGTMGFPFLGGAQLTTGAQFIGVRYSHSHLKNGKKASTLIYENRLIWESQYIATSVAFHYMYIMYILYVQLCPTLSLGGKNYSSVTIPGKFTVLAITFRFPRGMACLVVA